MKEKKRAKREALKFIKQHGFKSEETLPKALYTYADYVEFQEKWGFKKPTFQEYEQALTEHKKKQIALEEAEQARQTKLSFRDRKVQASKFLRFDLFPRMNKNCERFRLQHLGLFDVEETFSSEHLDLCESCPDWFYNFKMKQLEPRPTENSETNYSNYVKHNKPEPLPSEQDNQLNEDLQNYFEEQHGRKY